MRKKSALTGVTDDQLKALRDGGWEGGVMQSEQVIGISPGGGWEATHLKHGLRPTETFSSENLNDVIAEAEKWLGGQTAVKGLAPATDQGTMKR